VAPFVFLLLSVGLASSTAAWAQPAPAGNVRLTPGPGIEAHNSPTAAQNPTDPRNLVVVERVDRPTFSAALHTSFDGGRTWRTRDFPVPSGEDRPYAPDLAFGEDGTLYLEFVTLEGRGNSPGAVWLARSSDGGVTFSKPNQVLGPHAFQVRLAVDVQRSPDRLWLTWLQADAEAVHCQNCFNRTGLPILAALSDDGGESWSDAVRVSHPERARVGAPVPVVGSDGRLLVLYYDFRSDRIDWENLEGRYAGRFELVVARSTGTSAFSESVVNDDIVPPDRFLPYIPPFPSLALSGDIAYAGWHDNRNGDWDVFLARSGDGGVTWSKPVRINDDPVGNGKHQYLPTVAAAAGRTDIAFYDRRGDPNNIMTELYLAYSEDEGETFAPNLRVSSQGFSSRVGPEHTGTGGDFGSRVGLISVEDRALPVWTDTRNGTVATARQDIYGSVVTDLPGKGGDLFAPAVGLVAGVVAGIGGTLLIAARRRRGS
jgi:hypothetical protein